MRITLDQPTFINTPTTESTTPEGQEAQPDFLNFLSQLLAPEVMTPEVMTPLGIKPENQTETNELNAALVDQPNTDLNNLLIGMNYLAQLTAPKPSPDVNTQAVSSEVNVDAMQKSTAESRIPVSTPTTLLSNEGITPLPTPVPTNTNLQATQGMTKTGQDTPTSVANDEKEMIDARVSQVSKNATPPLTSDTLKPPVAQKTVSFAPNTKGKNSQPIENFVKNQLASRHEGSFIPVSESTEVKTPTSLIVQDQQGQKVTESLNQFAEWIQAKVNADPRLMNSPSTHSDALETTLKSLNMNTTETGAATPAKAAFEAKVEVTEMLSNADINLAHYQANIKIYPPELGKVTARLKMDKDGATLSVVAETKEVKALIENHLPNLREQFASSNIQLNKIEVTTSEPKGQANTGTDANARREARQEKAEGNRELDAELAKKAVKTKAKVSDTAVDAYV